MQYFLRVRLGEQGKYAQECFDSGTAGLDFSLPIDLTGKFTQEWRDFNKQFIPIYLKHNPEKTKVAAGLACAMLWTFCYGLQNGDIVISPYGNGKYRIGKIVGSYYYRAGQHLPHQRKVNWIEDVFGKEDFSYELLKSMRGPGTTAVVTKYGKEIENLIKGKKTNLIDKLNTFLSSESNNSMAANDDEEVVEDITNFALEKHLEDFLITNWSSTELAKKYKIFEDEGEKRGQQYPTDTGNIDILAISKDNKELLVIELKKGRPSDSVVGQIQRYMGYVKDVVADKGQAVKGMIIALNDDNRIRRALSVTQNIEFYTYKVNFKLEKAR
jgi:restriction system protein